MKRNSQMLKFHELMNPLVDAKPNRSINYAGRNPLQLILDLLYKNRPGYNP